MENEEDNELKIEQQEFEENKKNKYSRNEKILIAEGIIIILIIGFLFFYTAFSMLTSTTDKPIIYLYPEKETEISVKLKNPEVITCSYPKYENGWSVIAKPDGTLIDTKTNRTLYSLYWEGKGSANCDLTEGFCIKGEDTIEFLEEKLKILGLSDKETEEFIIYWLPQMQNNKYNYIRFATLEEINEYMPLEFSVEPDTLIRVLMQYKPLNKYIEVKEQILTTPKREGFVAVEWGGTKLGK